jgi:Mg-chelatase subunit ChlD
MAKKSKKSTVKHFTNFILIDASGSMESKASEVIGGLKTLFQSIKDEAKQYPKNIVTTIVCDFSGAKDFKVLVNTSKVEELTDDLANNYKTRGWTALYDAIGLGFKLIPEKQDCVFVNILTDGLENDSKEFNASDIKKLISDAKSKNWVVTFMGTTQDAIDNAVDLGISRGNTMQFADNNLGVVQASGTLSRSRVALYKSVVNDTSINYDTLLQDNS